MTVAEDLDRRLLAMSEWEDAEVPPIDVDTERFMLAEPDPQSVIDLAEQLSKGARTQPIWVAMIRGVPHCLDGATRTLAARQAGVEVDAKVRDLLPWEAAYVAVRLRYSAGDRLSNLSKRRLVAMLLESGEYWRKRSTALLASATRLSLGATAKYRSDWFMEEGIDRPKKVLTAHNRMFTDASARANKKKTRARQRVWHDIHSDEPTPTMKADKDRFRKAYVELIAAATNMLEVLEETSLYNKERRWASPTRLLKMLELTGPHSRSGDAWKLWALHDAMKRLAPIVAEATRKK